MRALRLLAGLLVVGALAWLLVVRSGGPAERQAAIEPADPARDAAQATAAGRAAPDADPAREALAEEPPAAEAEGPDGRLPLVRGRVVGPSGAPVADALVLGVARAGWSAAALDVEPRAFAGDREEPLEAWSDEAGRFELEGLLAGEAQLAVRAEGYAPLDLELVVVEERAPTDVGDLVLDPGLALEGRVVDLRGAGVPFAKIARSDPGGGGFGPEYHYAPLGHADAEGRFLVHGLRPGAWRVRVAHGEHPTAFYDGLHDEPGTSRGHVFRMEDGWSIDGRLVVPGVADLSGYTIAAKLLDPEDELGELPMEHRYRNVACEADGGFRFTGLRALAESTRFRLEPRRRSGNLVRRVGDEVEVHAGARGVQLFGEALATLRFELRERGTGAPVEDPKVWLVIQGGNHVDLTGRGSVEALGEGRYRIADVERASEGAEFALHIAKEGFRDHLRGQLGLAPGATSDLGLIELERPAVLMLELVDDATGAPVPDATVARESRSPYFHEVLRQGPSLPFDPAQGEAKSGADGVARVGLAIGHENRVFVAHPGFALDFGLVVEPLGPGEIARTLRLTRGATLLVRVRDGRGRPATSESVVLSPVEQGPTGMTAFRYTMPRRHARVGAEGVARFGHLRPGATRVRLQSDEDGTDAVVVQLEEGGTHEVELGAPERALLEGLVREEGAPLADAEVHLVAGRADPHSDEAAFVSGTSTDARGRFEIPNLEVGDYELGVSHPARLLATWRSVSVREGAPPVTIDLSVPRVTGEVADAAGEPLPGAVVLVAPANAWGAAEVVSHTDLFADMEPGESWGDPRIGWMHADESGRFELRGLPPGLELSAVAFASGHQPAASPGFTLDEGERRDLGRLVATPGARLRVVLDVPPEEKRRSWGYEVRATRLGDAAVRRTEFGGSGECSFDHLAPGEWTVALHAQFSEKPPLATTKVVLGAGETGEVALKPR